MQKRDKIFLLSIGILFVIAIFLLFFFQEQTLVKEEARFQAMGFPVSVQIFVEKKEDEEKIFNDIKAIYEKYETLTNREEGPLKNIRENDSKEENITIDEELYELLRYGKSWYEKSDGALDITLGDAYDLWNQKITEEKKKPTDKELKRISSKMEKLNFLSNHQITNNHVNLNLDAIRMGYATEEAAHYLEKNGITHYLINASSVIRAGKYYEEGKSYIIKMESPYENADQSILSSVQFTDQAIAIKSSYWNAYHLDDELVSYLLDSKTKKPANYMASVIVIAPTAKEADALSSILFTMSIPDGLEYIEAYPEAAASWAYTDEDGKNRKVSTDNFFSYIG